MNLIYSPEEDSYLLSKVLEKEIPNLLSKNLDLTFLEIGSGSGIQLKTALKLGIKKQNIFSCDINPAAVEHCRTLRFSSEAIKKIAVPQRKGKLSGPKDKGVSFGEENRRLSRGFNCVYSDLFENIKSKYDLIIFNPPYLPEDSQEPKDSKISTTGGEKGSEIINEFLKQAKNHLNENGKIFLLTSSLTKEINFLDYNKNILEKKKLFFEELFVWELNL